MWKQNNKTMLLGIIIGGVIGFVIGALVFRNNTAKMNQLIEEIKQLKGKI